MSTDAQPEIVIAGAGVVGLALALALRSALPGLAVRVIDAKRSDAVLDDRRASAIGAANRRMLGRLGAWATVEAEAQPIEKMVVGDSRPEDVGRPVFLTFESPVGEGEPFAHMVPNGTLLRAVRDRAVAAGVELVWQTSIVDFEARGEAVEISLEGRGHAVSRVEAKLLVAADGGRSRLRALGGIAAVERDYGQSGLVLTVEHERPHNGVARQDFLPAGPFAVLPLRGNRSSLVWTEKREIAKRLLHADPLELRAELELRFGHQLGEVRPVDALEAYPLRLLLARSFVARRLALCGDAAHIVHPLAGQGLNLGLQDVAALAETVVEAIRLGLDPGSEEVLARYQRWRRYDTVEMALATDGLNRLFSNDSAPLRLLRDVGLGLVDRLPRLKEAFIRRAAGLERRTPRLLQGLPI